MASIAERATLVTRWDSTGPGWTRINQQVADAIFPNGMTAVDARMVTR